MNNSIRSLEDASDHVILMLRRLLKVNTIVIAINDDAANHIFKVYNRQEPLILQEMIPTTCVIDTLFGAYPHLSVPILSSCHTTYGAIHILDSSPIELDQDELALLESSASLLSYAIELENATITDSLTGLYNRRFLDILFNSSTEMPIGVMFIDLNDFKDINDEYGHDFGDLLLIEIAKRLREHIRKTDRVIRYGGDEFVICFKELSDDNGIRIVEDKITNAILEPFLINGKLVSISASIGISTNQGVYVNLKQLIADADLAMYLVKQNHKKP